MSAALAHTFSVEPSAFEVSGVWRADQLAQQAGQVLSTGYAALDAQLPGGGWPVGAMTELLQVQPGLGEWGLLLPALANLLPVGTSSLEGASSKALVLVGAPCVPFGSALQARGLDAQRLLWVRCETPAARSWACEQALRCADVAAVLAWLPQVRLEALRRLHLAAHEHGKLLWVLRAAQARHESSAAPLRLLLEGSPSGAHDLAVGRVHILKRRGPPLEQPISVQWQSTALQSLLGAARERAQGRQREPGSPETCAPQALQIRTLHVLDCLAAVV